MDYCKYVNVFHGNGQIDLPKPRGIAAKWFFIKAQCGNTNPAACLPFGGMSVCPYSGGYPTGYGDHKVNTHAHPAKFENGKKLIGFAHLQQSGTGTIGFYYNYALTVPFYDNSPFRRLPENEYGEPGYYSCSLENIKCELTADNRVAYHRYSFGCSGGKVKIDFSNNGLNLDGELRGTVSELNVRKTNECIAAADAMIEGIHIFFAVKGNGKLEITDKEAVYSDFGKEANIKVAISLKSEENALKFLNEATDFDTAKANAHNLWNDALSKVSIKTDDERIKRIFYSNLYHSLIKPCDRSGDGFLYKNDDAFMVDFATLWDMYKTAMPLICMVYKDTAQKSVDTLLSICDELGYIPNSFSISTKFAEHNTQARALGCYVLMTAYRYGISIDPHRMVKAIARDIFAPDKTDFTVDGKCTSHTFMLDMADCCRLASDIASEIGENEIAEELRPLSGQWIKCYSEETGLLGEDSEYYEGTLYNYSFRQMADMEKRIEIAGGKENFVKLLDRFFGYGRPDVIQPSDPKDIDYIQNTMKKGIFEGFNNESDTESPFSYIYAGRHDRTCEIVRAGMKYMFTEGKGGIPGNNDSDALSSYYVFMALGIFPVAGQNLFLIGSPFVDSAVISLSNGKKLEIEVNGNSEDNIYVKSVSFNGKEINNFSIPADVLMQGGKMEFTMTNRI